MRDRLLRACQRLGVRFAYDSGLQGLEPRAGGGWELGLAGGRREAAARVILATGGLSFPALGTTGDGFKVLEQQLGHSLHPPYAALTPLLGSHPGGQQLAGISLYSAELSALPAASDGGGGGGGKKKKGGGGAKAQRSAMLFTCALLA